MRRRTDSIDTSSSSDDGTSIGQKQSCEGKRSQEDGVGGRLGASLFREAIAVPSAFFE